MIKYMIRPLGGLLLCATPSLSFAQDLPPFEMDAAERGARLTAILQDDPARTDALAAQAHLTLTMGEFDLAMDLARRLCDATPSDPYGPYYLARAHLGRREYRLAREAFVHARAQLTSAPDLLLEDSIQQGLTFLDDEQARFDLVKAARGGALRFVLAAASCWLVLLVFLGLLAARSPGKTRAS